MRETIFARATPAGVAGVCVVRISGPDALRVSELFEFDLPKPRRAALRSLCIDDALIDRALVLVFGQGQSFTGESVVELHLHGSVIVQQIVLKHLSTVPQFRMADAGEFTRRALESGQLTLTEVEGLSDLLMAETEAQHRQAMQVFNGKLTQLVEDWRRRCLWAMAQITVSIDFADEEVPEEIGAEVARELRSMSREMHEAAEGGRGAERVREGFEVAIVGAPNVGKSTLLNFIAGREAALTSEMAGTTRDIIEVRYNLAGLPVTFLDTAGVREGTDPVEKLGIARALTRAEEADLRVILGGIPTGLTVSDDDIRVEPKADLMESVTDRSISGVSGFGVDALLKSIGQILEKRMQGSSLAIRERHRIGFDKASDSLVAASEHLECGGAEEFAAEHLTLAMRYLDVVIGKIEIEEVLGEVFSQFCIGK